MHNGMYNSGYGGVSAHSATLTTNERMLAMAEFDLDNLPENVKAIPLTKGKHAIVDADDYDFLMQWKWYFNNGYAARKPNIQIYMHRLVARTPTGMDTDHINKNTLDNRKTNLRICTRSQNNGNSKKRGGGKASSIYKGVCFHRAAAKWMAQIGTKDRNIYLGLYDSEEEAAIAYNLGSSQYFGKFSRQNTLP